MDADSAAVHGGMMSFARQSALVMAVSGAVMFVNLGGARLWDRDEPRNAGCGAEMLHRGDWVTPVFNGQLRSHKPVLLYWFMMSAYAVLGVTEFAARFWSAALACGTCWLTLWIGRRLFNPRVGLWAALILCSTMMFTVAGRAATPDSVLIFFTTAALAVYVRGAFPQGSATPLDPQGEFPGWLSAAGMYALMGLAVLAKGPVGLVLPTAVIGMYLLLRRLPAAPAPRTWLERAGMLLRPFEPRHFAATCWRMRPATAVAVVALVAGPWYVWVGLRTNGAWLQGFFWEHNFNRAVTPMENHGGPPFYYLAALLAGFFPWSVFAAPTLRSTAEINTGHPWRRGQTLALCCVGVFLGIFTLARTKLPSYITPCYPGAALLTASFVIRWAEGETAFRERWVRAAAAALILIGAGLAIALPIAASIVAPGEQVLGVLGLAPLIGGGGFYWLARRGQRWPAVQLLAVSAVALVIGGFAWGAGRVDRRREFGAMLTAIAARSDRPRIATYECMEPSWAFYSRHRIHGVWLESQRGRRAIARERELPPWSGAPRQDLAQFVRAGGDAFIITTDHHYRRLKDKLPAELKVISTTQLFLKDERLVLLYAPPTASAAASLSQASNPKALAAPRSSASTSAVDSLARDPSAAQRLY